MRGRGGAHCHVPRGHVQGAAAPAHLLAAPARAPLLTPRNSPHAQTHLQLSGTSSVPTFLRANGFLRLWRGAPAVLMGCVPSHAAYFSAYEVGKARMGADAPGHHPIAGMKIEGRWVDVRDPEVLAALERESAA